LQSLAPVLPESPAPPTPSPARAGDGFVCAPGMPGGTLAVLAHPVGPGPQQPGRAVADVPTVRGGSHALAEATAPLVRPLFASLCRPGPSRRLQAVVQGRRPPRGASLLGPDSGPPSSRRRFLAAGPAASAPVRPQTHSEVTGRTRRVLQRRRQFRARRPA